MISTTAMRELAELQTAFEEWMASSNYPEIADIALAKLPSGQYKSQLTFAAFQGWQGGYRHALSAPGWADISTAPPERDGSYIVANDLREVCPAQLRDGHWLVSNMPGFADWTWGHTITHYMPLPEPPK